MGSPCRRMRRAPSGDGSVRRRAARWLLSPRVTVAGFALLVITLTTMSTAWACVPQPALSVQPLGSGPPGSRLTIEGANFDGGRVELRWNGLDGPLLGSGTGGSFTVPITIPDVPDGLYTLVALERRQDGSVGGVARAPFQLGRSTGSASTSTLPPAGVGDDQDSTSTVFPVTLGVPAAIAVLLVGAVAGAAIGRRRRAATVVGLLPLGRDHDG